MKATAAVSVASVLVGLAVAGCASTPRSGSLFHAVQVTGPFTHASGMVFPEASGPFVRTSVVEFANRRDDFGINYRLVLLGVTVSVYVYPQSTGSLDGEFRSVARDVATFYEVQPYLVTRITVRVAGKATPGKVASYEFAGGERGGQALTMKSHAYVFVSGQWVVEYRATGPKDVDDTLQREVQGLVERLGFPPAGHA